jgi:predicted phage terminase large subunit-like protein
MAGRGGRKHEAPTTLSLLPGGFTGTVQSWDTANKATELSDFSVCTTWGVCDHRYYLLDVFRKRLNYPDLKRAACDLARLHHPTSIVIEDKASGTQLIQDLKTDGLGRIKPFEPPPGTDKVMRLHVLTPLFENGRVLLPRRAPWLNDYVAELTGFPGTKFNDQVDSTTQALQFLKEGSDKAEAWARFGRSLSAYQVQDYWGYRPFPLAGRF